MSTLQATRNLFTTCAVYEHHLYTESRIHAAACGVCQPEYSDAVYATVVDRGTHITHVQMAEVWNCVCNNGGYANMQSTMPRCMARAFLSAAALDSAYGCFGGRDSSLANGVADAKVDNADDTGKCCYVNVFRKRKCFRMFSRNVVAHT